MNEDHARWLDAADPGWTRVDLPFPATSSRFVSEDETGRRLAVRFFRRDDDGAVRVKVLCGPEASGPPGHAHGGCMAALLDEAMGAAAWMSGHPVLAAELNVSFKRMLPLDTPCVIEARVAEVEDRKVNARSVLRDPGGEVVYCTATALLIELDEQQLLELAEMTRRALEDDQGKDA